jgi:cyclopropane-fatty-acyl-phospholipid synthase
MPTIAPQPTRDFIHPDTAGVETAREIVQRAFDGISAGVAVSLADGASLHQPSEPVQATIVLRHPWVLRALLSRGSDLAAGEAVLRGDLAVVGSVEQALVAMDAVAAARTPLEWVAIASLAARLPRQPSNGTSRDPGPVRLRGRLHSPERDRAAIAYHYDVSNAFYELWLDEQLSYSCAYFRDEADTLEQAQTQKYEIICRKLRLHPGERFLDVGCGWGGLVRFASREYGVHAVGVTLSQRQAEYAKARIAREGLADRCRIESLDYRELGALGTFEKAASVGMVEHVGDRNLGTYFGCVFAALAPGGLFLNHGIVAQHPPAGGMRALAQRFFPQRSRFTESYVFPDGQMPRLAPMTESAQAAGFEVRDVENLREHYARTLREWLHRLEGDETAAREIVGDETYRVWRYWLAGSAHSFAIGRLGVVQMLLARWTPDARAHVPQTREDIYA